MADMYLSHHGILGQKWGIRRYQNPDGTWTDAGKKRYNTDIEKAEDKRRKEIQKAKGNFRGVSRNAHDLKRKIFEDELRNSKEYKEYAKASEKESKYTSYSKSYNPAKANRLVKNSREKYDAYNKRINDTYKKHESEILSARLKDLKLPDTKAYQDFYKQYHQTKVSSLGYDPDSYLQLFID